jgi:hypothetical protein
MTLIRRKYLHSWVVRSLLALLLLFSASSPFIVSNNAKALDWVGWNAINTIYYNPNQEDPNNSYLATAASELDNYLTTMSGRSWIVVTSSNPGGAAIRLVVNASAPEFTNRSDESFHLVANSNGIYITGKTPIAVREGAYYLLDEKLGVRWFFKSDIWTVVPSSLAAIGAIDEVHEPDYFWRELHLQPFTDGNVTDTWLHRNRLGGSELYWFGESYDAILPKTAANFNAHPEYFLPMGSGLSDWPWQLDPRQAGVLAAAISFAESQLNRAPTEFYGDKLPANSASMCPNDGGGWDPPWSQSTTEGQQAITDAVTALANNVLKAVKGEYPDAKIGVYNYAQYCQIPSFNLEPNLVVVISLLYNYGSLTTSQRITGIKSKGAKVGIYDALDVWQWYHDQPCINLDQVSKIADYASDGAELYTAECSDAWGSRGLTYYIASKLLWDSSTNVYSILDDFYAKAFGVAQEPMREYFEGQLYGDEDEYMAHMGVNFVKLQEAESLAAGNSAILARIRFLEYYQRFLWLYHDKGITNLSLTELKNFYTFITKIRNLYIIDYYHVEPSIRAELTSRGLTNSQINALQNFSPPTAGEAAAYLNEALAVFEDQNDINPYYTSLKALGNTSVAELTPITSTSETILVPSNGNENVTVMVKGSSIAVEWYGDITWNDNVGTLLDTKALSGFHADWTPLTFYAPAAGLYKVKISNRTNTQSIIVPNRPASIVADENEQPRICGSGSLYFYVPVGTASFTLGATGTGTSPATITLYNPSGNVVNNSNITTSKEWVYNSPAAGIWKVSTSCSNYSQVWLKGILPLLWHDPEYLLVQASNAGNAADVNQDTVVNILDIIRVVQHWGESGPNGWVPEDVNRDGVIDVLDITYIGRYWT